MVVIVLGKNLLFKSVLAHCELIITEKSSLIAIFTQAENEGFFYIFNYYVSGLLEGVIDASANNIENVEAGQSKEKLMKDIPQ